MTECHRNQSGSSFFHPFLSQPVETDRGLPTDPRQRLAGWVVSILTSAVWLGDWCHVVLCPLSWAEGVDFGGRERRRAPKRGNRLQGGKSWAFLISSIPVPSLSAVVFKIRASIVLFYILFYKPG